jgi:hypothetical protein
MPIPLQPELYWLTLTCLMTGLLWVPYILQLIVQLGRMTPIGRFGPSARITMRSRTLWSSRHSSWSWC